MLHGYLSAKMWKTETAVFAKASMSYLLFNPTPAFISSLVTTAQGIVATINASRINLLLIRYLLYFCFVYSKNGFIYFVYNAFYFKSQAYVSAILLFIHNTFSFTHFQKSKINVINKIL